MCAKMPGTKDQKWERFTRGVARDVAQRTESPAVDVQNQLLRTSKRQVKGTEEVLAVKKKKSRVAKIFRISEIKSKFKSKILLF